MWWVRSATGAIWLLASALASYWGLTLWASSNGRATAAVSIPVAGSTKPGVPTADVARLLGARATQSVREVPTAPLVSRYRLVGVLASPGSQGLGVALIATETGPAKAYRVGAALEGGYRLRQVEARRVAIQGDGGAMGGEGLVWLELPVPTKAATATPLPANAAVSAVPAAGATSIGAMTGASSAAAVPPREATVLQTVKP